MLSSRLFRRSSGRDYCHDFAFLVKYLRHSFLAEHFALAIVQIVPTYWVRFLAVFAPRRASPVAYWVLIKEMAVAWGRSVENRPGTVAPGWLGLPAGWVCDVGVRTRY